jgi:hypothetical protein
MGSCRLQPHLPSFDFVKLGKRSFKFAIEEPHRIKNFTMKIQKSAVSAL